MSASNEKKLLVFLSHASQDKATVRGLCERLKSDGFDPWLDEERLLPGMNWDMEIEKALRASDVLLLCFSNLSVSKEGYIQREFKRAKRYQEEKPEGTIYLIPVRLDKCELPYDFKDVQFVDFPEGYDRLVVSLNIRSGKLASAPPIPAKKEPEKTASAVSSGNSKEGFEKIAAQIDGMPDDPDVDKTYLKMFLRDIEKEVAQGSSFNEKKLKVSLKMLMQSSEEIYSSVAQLLKSSEANIPIEIRNLLD